MSHHENMKKIRFRVRGMHCASCEVLVEREWRKIPGIVAVKSNHASGRAEVIYEGETPRPETLERAIASTGYSVSRWSDASANEVSRPTARIWAEIGGIAILFLAVYALLSRFGFTVGGLTIGGNMSYWFIFGIGIVAAFSTCMAVTGGLLLAVAARYAEDNPTLTPEQKFVPHVWFNAGRLISYGVLGGVVGALGSIVSFSGAATGYLTILASAVMILLGFQILGIFPSLRRFYPRMPKAIAHRFADPSGKSGRMGALLLGATTFFLPCGFTQALQLYVLSAGDPVRGALTMFVFALGTTPALLSVGAISSWTKGAVRERFFRVAGVLVVLLGILGFRAGTVLAGMNFDLAAFLPSGENSAPRNNATNVEFVDGVQVARMTVKGYGYSPNKFTVVAGVPVEWRINGEAATGCAQIITAPSIRVNEFMKSVGETIIRFTPQKAGRIAFNCSMGMATPNSAFTVVAAESLN